MVLTALLGVLVSLTPLANAQATSTPGNNQTSQTTNTGQQNTSSQEKSPEPTESNNLIKAGKEYNKGTVATFIYDILISIGGFFVWLGGLALDTSISLLVVGMGEFVRSTMLVAINELWTIVRDIFNILFIFGLIYIGFKTILGTDETGTKRALVMLIAAALLINFSLLFTKAIVDFSNATAFQIYGLLGGAEATYQTTQDSTPTKGIAASFMQVADLTSFANTQSQDSLEKMSDTNFIIYGLFTMFLMLIAAFVFLAGAFMLVARFVILIFSMIFSPAMFLGWIFPQFDKLSSQWWHRFLSNAFMAPAFLFMIFLTLKSIQTINHNGSLFDAFQGNSYLTDSFGVIIIFFVMIGFLYGSLLVSQRLGAAGASQVMNVSNNIQGRLKTYASSAGRVPIRAGGRVAQWGIGGAANRLGKAMDNSRASKEAPRSRFGRSLRSAVSGVENAKFGATTSRKERSEEDKKEAISHARSHAVHKIKEGFKTGGVEAEKAAVNASGAQILEIAKNKEGREMLLEQAGLLTSSQVSEIMKSETIDDTFKSQLGEKVSEKTYSKVTQEKPADLSKASKAQIKAIGAEKLKQLETAVHLTTEQLKHVESEMVESEANQIKDARKRALLAVAESNEKGVYGKTKQDLLNMKPLELPKEVLIKLSVDLPVDSLEKIARSDKIDPNVKRTIRDNIEGRNPDLINPNPPTKPPKELPEEELTDAHRKWRFLNQNSIGQVFGT